MPGILYSQNGFSLSFFVSKIIYASPTMVKDGKCRCGRKSSLVSFIVKRPWAGASITHSQFLQSKLMLCTKKAPP